MNYVGSGGRADSTPNPAFPAQQWGMETLLDCLAAAVIPLAFLAYRYRRDLRKARVELKASIQAGELLCHELDSFKTMAALLERSNYQLAVQVHGRAAVDRAIAEAHERGVN
jgi:hypothetical protein